MVSRVGPWPSLVTKNALKLVLILLLSFALPLAHSAGPGKLAGWAAESNQTQAVFGMSVSMAGDVNGDGYSDVIVGSPWYSNGEYREGRAFLYYGSSSGLSANPGWTREGNQAEAQFGYSVASAGDINKDGYSDIIVGAPWYDNGQENEGRVFLYYGSPTGPSQTPSWSAEGNQAWAFFGWSVASAGDVNKDGFSDILVGAPYYENMTDSPQQTNEGRAFAYFGSPTGPAATPGWVGEGGQLGAEFGESLNTAGDVNGDGYSDIIIGAHLYDRDPVQGDDSGKALVFHGSPTGPRKTPSWSVAGTADSDYGGSVSTAGDVDGDGYWDVIVGSAQYTNGETWEGRAYLYRGSATGLSASASWTVESNQAQSLFGYSVAYAGDVNRDGLSDVLVGAYQYDDPEVDEGRVFEYNGKSTGLETIAAWTQESNQTSAYYGWSVASAGDVNHDGTLDIIIGASFYDNGQNDEGRALEYYGIPIPDSVAPTWPPGSLLTPSNLGPTSLTLSWTAAADNVRVSNYRVYQGTTLLATVPPNVREYNVTGLGQGYSYTFRVEAGDPAGNWSANGPSITVTTLGSTSGGGGGRPLAK